MGQTELFSTHLETNNTFLYKKEIIVIIMADVRKILVIFLIGVLYAIFVQSLIEAIYPSPDYEDYCGRDSMPEPMALKMGVAPQNCTALLEQIQCDKGGNIEYTHDSNGCPISTFCNYCNVGLEKAQEQQRLVVFIVSSVMALIAIGIGLALPVKKNPLNEWIGTGFLLGGLITLFIGTIRYYADMTRILRPLVLLIELFIVIFLAYKKLKK